MNFNSEQFPNQQVCISFFALQVDADNNVLSPLFQLQEKFADSISIINNKNVASILHLNIALSRALINKRDF